ncbi:hypothetical protein [Roseibium sp. Sym1]|uniref:hypothetical protein n=1 Tax=Roseibium sp. Sym1 TaxID=3016006 RepID=UPI0022B5270E|nr:hypothetical protein [Roseibium sp. Sym1]
MNSQAFGDQVGVRYPLRRKRQRVSVRRRRPIEMRTIRVRTGPKPVNWGQRLLIAVAGFVCGLAADSLVMFAEHHFHLAKDRDPDLFAIVLGTGLAGHTLYLVFGALAVTLLTAFKRRKWIVWVLIGFVGGLLSV